MNYLPKLSPKMISFILNQLRNNRLQNQGLGTCCSKFSNTFYHLRHNFQNTYCEHHEFHNIPNYRQAPILFLLKHRRFVQQQMIQLLRLLLQQHLLVHQQTHLLMHQLQLLQVRLPRSQFSYLRIQITQLVFLQ